MDPALGLMVMLVASTAVFLVLVVKTSLGVAKSLAVTLVFIKLFAGAFMVMGIDRPLFVVKTRVGDATITAMMVILLSAFLTNFWIISRIERLERWFGHA